VSFAAVTLCVASQRVVIVVYIDSVRKVLDTPSYMPHPQELHILQTERPSIQVQKELETTIITTATYDIKSPLPNERLHIHKQPKHGQLTLSIRINAKVTFVNEDPIGSRKM
jgi:hypothetical protein